MVHLLGLRCVEVWGISFFSQKPHLFQICTKPTTVTHEFAEFEFVGSKHV